MAKERNLRYTARMTEIEPYEGKKVYYKVWPTGRGYSYAVFESRCSSRPTTEKTAKLMSGACNSEQAAVDACEAHLSLYLESLVNAEAARLAEETAPRLGLLHID